MTAFRAGDLARNRTLAVALLLATAACGQPQSPPTGPAQPLPWVSPARCVRPCTHPDESHLVSVDARARLAADGAYRFNQDARGWLEAFLDAAARAGYDVTLGWGFRTYQTQAMVWTSKLSEPGLGARPGHSEHELGLAGDLAYATSGAPAWLAAHAWEYGFVLSFPGGAQMATGFRYEPWHFRWVGPDVARTLHQTPDFTLEELFESTPGLGESGDCSDCPLAESRSTCEGLDTLGRCDASVLHWCFKGAANAVDCAGLGLQCRSDAAGATCGR